MVDILFVTVGVFRVMDAAAKAKHQSPFLKRYPAISSSGNFFFFYCLIFPLFCLVYIG